MDTIYPITWETEPSLILQIDECYARAAQDLTACVKSLDGGGAGTGAMGTINAVMQSGGGCDTVSFTQNGSAPLNQSAGEVKLQIENLITTIREYINHAREQMEAEKEHEKEELLRALKNKKEALLAIRAGRLRVAKSYQEKLENLSSDDSEYYTKFNNYIEKRDYYVDLAEESTKEIAKIDDKIAETEAINPTISGYIDGSGNFVGQNLSEDSEQRKLEFAEERDALWDQVSSDLKVDLERQGFEGETVNATERETPSGETVVDLTVSHEYSNRDEPLTDPHAVNEYIDNMQVDENGRLTEEPPIFIVSSDNRLDIPGFGCCYRATGDGELAFYYDPATNAFYDVSDFRNENDDYSNVTFNPDDMYSLTVDEMRDSWVAQGALGGKL